VVQESGVIDQSFEKRMQRHCMEKLLQCESTSGDWFVRNLTETAKVEISFSVFFQGGGLYYTWGMRLHRCLEACNGSLYI
jgi:hypothetical protein